MIVYITARGAIWGDPRDLIVYVMTLYAGTRGHCFGF